MDNFLNELTKYDTCIISDSLDRLGLSGAVTELKRQCTKLKLVGTVRTIKLEPIGGQKPKYHLGAKVIDSARPGDVVVVDNAGRTNISGWGGMLSTAAKMNGIRGTIVDGAFRDVDECEELNYPVFARTAVPVTPKGRYMETSFDTPVSICGLTVNPGDYVIADGSGVVFIAKSKIEKVLSTASEIFAREIEIIKKIKNGEKIVNIMGEKYENC